MSLRDSDWFYDRRAHIGDLIELCKNDEELVSFLKNEKDRMCMKCEYWDHENSGHYDSGKIALCKHPKIFGNHHPSNGCGVVEQTLAYVPYTLSMDGDGIQEIQTRWNFGCNLWEKKNG